MKDPRHYNIFSESVIFVFMLYSLFNYNRPHFHASFVGIAPGSGFAKMECIRLAAFYPLTEPHFTFKKNIAISYTQR